MDCAAAKKAQHGYYVAMYTVARRGALGLIGAKMPLGNRIGRSMFDQYIDSPSQRAIQVARSGRILIWFCEQ